MARKETYTGCRFFAEKTSGRKGAKLAGTVVIVAKRPERNGQCVAVVGVPRGDRKAVPVKSWAHPDYLATKCVEVTETEARAIHPEMFEASETYERAPEYRIGHAIETARAFRAGLTLQPADMGGVWVGHNFRRIYGA
jgi:hypothetical protein